MSIETLLETRSLLPALMQGRKPKAFLRNALFRDEKTFDSEHVDIDIWRQKQRRAAHVKLFQEGTNVERETYETRTYKPLPLKPKMVTTARQAFKRAAGETPYSNVTPAQRAQKVIAEDMLTLLDMIGRTEELMCSEALFSDAVYSRDIGGNALNTAVSFGRPSTHQVTSGQVTSTYGGLWDASGSNPLETLRLLKRTVARSCDFVPTMAVFAADMIDMFLDHTEVKDRLKDTRGSQVEIIAKYPNYLVDGAVFIGRVEGLDIFEYMGTIRDDWTDPASPSTVDLVPAKKILLSSPEARSEMLYGAVDHLDSLHGVARFPHSWRTPDGSQQWLELISRPLPCPHQVDAHIVAQVDA